MNVRFWSFAALSVASLGLAACGGGGSTIPSGPVVVPTVTIPQSSTPVTACSGGTVSVTLPGGGAASLNVAAGALLQNATVTLTVYTSAASLPKTFASTGRKAQSIPAGSTFLVGFAVDLGGATLTKPIQITEASSALPSGTVARLALYSATSNGFNDVDTATIAGPSVSNDLNKAYVGISSGTSALPYAFYAVPAANAATPAPIKFSASSAVAGPFFPGSAIKFTPAGADTNGNPYAFVPVVTLDNSSLGTLATTSTPPYAATLTAGTIAASGNVVVSDAARSLTGKTSIAVGTSRPIGNGDAFTYSGTLVQTFNRTLPTCNSGRPFGYRLGNPNGLFYQLYNGWNTKSTLKADYAGIFTDVIYGNNSEGTPGKSGGPPTFFSGYNAGPGYDLTTGIGVPHAGHLITDITGIAVP